LNKSGGDTNEKGKGPNDTIKMITCDDETRQNESIVNKLQNYPITAI
jgi:hypothetical protein